MESFLVDYMHTSHIPAPFGQGWAAARRLAGNDRGNSASYRIDSATFVRFVVTHILIQAHQHHHYPTKGTAKAAIIAEAPPTVLPSRECENEYSVSVYCNLPVFELVLGPLHDEEPRQYVDEHPPHPGRHFVCLGRPEVDVKHQDRHTYTAAASDT
ncbi:hypothetical protein E2C01_029059 [Portunus trituberculatus]|uniref:Uncharacterized protein n=1 Tax=Portunus trituberculatus TaxID=210409 RepID=A0A5B7ERT7_PORTR|nr:hypothetical protein [Portunus trituberculatus]